MSENRARAQKIWGALQAIQADAALVLAEVDQNEVVDDRAVATYATRINSNAASAALSLSAIEIELDEIFGRR